MLNYFTHFLVQYSFSEEDTTSEMQSGGISWYNLARAVEERSGK